MMESQSKELKSVAVETKWNRNKTASTLNEIETKLKQNHKGGNTKKISQPSVIEPNGFNTTFNQNKTGSISNGIEI